MVKEILQSIIGDKRISIEAIEEMGKYLPTTYLAKVLKETTREEI